MLLAPLTCFSMAAATDCSTTLALAPRYCACTCTSGGAIGGNWATGSVTMAKAPSSTITIESTIANTGRWMKKRDMLVCCDDGDFGARLYVLRALDHHAFARFDAVGDHVTTAELRAERERTLLHDVVRTHDVRGVGALRLDHGRLRNHDGAASYFGDHPHACELAGPQVATRVREERLHGNRSGFRVELAAHGVQLAGLGIDAAVGKHEAQFLAAERPHRGHA